MLCKTCVTDTMKYYHHSDMSRRHTLLLCVLIFALFVRWFCKIVEISLAHGAKETYEHTNKLSTAVVYFERLKSFGYFFWFLFLFLTTISGKTFNASSAALLSLFPVIHTTLNATLLLFHTSLANVYVFVCYLVLCEAAQ